MFLKGIYLFSPNALYIVLHHENSFVILIYVHIFFQIISISYVLLVYS